MTEFRATIERGNPQTVSCHYRAGLFAASLFVVTEVEHKIMKVTHGKVRQWEDALLAMYGDGWEDLTAKEICKLLGYYQKLSPPSPTNDNRGREYQPPKHNSMYMTEIVAEVRFEYDNEDEVIDYFQTHAYWSEEANPRRTMVWVESNDDYSPEQDWNVRVHGLAWYDNAVDMLSDASERISFIMEAPDACYETKHGSIAQTIHFKA